MALAPDAVTTFERVEGYRVVRSFGYAYGSASRPRNVLKQTFRSIGVLIGLAPVDYLTDAERTRTESLEMLLRKAEGMGANGVLGLQFQASEGPDGATRVLAFGEAVLLEPRAADEPARARDAGARARAPVGGRRAVPQVRDRRDARATASTARAIRAPR